jgi:hypothetical protein
VVLAESQRLDRVKGAPASGAGRLRGLYVSIGLLLVGQGLILARIFGFSADDALIVSRYAENLVDGRGLIFNVGERINALTSPLHALIEGVLYAVTRATVTANKLTSIVCVLCATGLLVWRLRERPFAALLLPTLVLLSPFVNLWAIGGLETPYLLLLVTSIAVLAERSESELPRMRAAGIGVLIGLAFLARFDSVLFSAPVALWLLLRHHRKAISMPVCAALVGGAWLVFSQSYFHDVLPTSFYRKTPATSPVAMFHNATYVAQFFVLSGLALLGLELAIRAVRDRGRQKLAEAARRWWWLWAALGTELMYSLLVARTHMMFSGRVLVPYLPLLVYALLRLREAVVDPAHDRRSTLLLAPALLGLNLFGTWLLVNKGLNVGWMGEYKRESLDSYTNEFSRVLRQQARDIRAHWRAQPQSGSARPIVFTAAAGILPYELREATTFDGLVSYRSQCLINRQTLSHYLHYLVPRHVKPAELPKDMEVVSKITFPFDGNPRETSYILYRPDPLPNTLPPYAHGPCRSSP